MTPKITIHCLRWFAGHLPILQPIPDIIEAQLVIHTSKRSVLYQE